MAADQMIGPVERNKTLRMLGRDVDQASVLDAHALVPRRMENQ